MLGLRRAGGVAKYVDAFGATLQNMLTCLEYVGLCSGGGADLLSLGHREIEEALGGLLLGGWEGE